MICDMSTPPVSQYVSTDARDAVAPLTRIALALGVVVFLAMTPVTMLVAPLKELIGERFAVGDGVTHAFMAVNLLGALVAAPLIGWLADHHGRRRAVAVAALVFDGLCLALMALAPNVPTLFALRFLEGAAHILAISTLMAVAAGWAPPGRRGRIMGIVGASMMFGTTAGTPLGGFVYRHLLTSGTPDSLFLVAGAIAAGAAGAAALLVRESHAQHSPRTPIRDILSLLRQDRRLAVPYAYAFVDRLCVGVLITTFSIFLKDVHGFTPAERGALFTAFLLPFAGLVYPAGRLVDRIGPATPIVVGSVAFGVVFALYGMLPRNWLLAVMVLSGILSALMFAPTLTLCIELSGGARRGVAYTGFNLAGSLGMICGPLLGAASLTLCRRHFDDSAAFEATFIITGLTELLCAAATLPLLLKYSRPGSAHTPINV